MICKTVVVIGVMFVTTRLFSDTPKKSDQGNPSGPNATQLPGISYVKTDWPTALPSGKHNAVLCFTLKGVPGSSVQPLILEPRQSPTAPCRTVDENHPLLVRDKLVVAIFATPSATDKLKLLNINVTSQQGSPTNPAPVRPTLSTTGGGAQPQIQAEQEATYYLSWPFTLTGDTIPTVVVSGIYAPDRAAGTMQSGSPWQQSTVYPTGSVVSASGHVFTAQPGTSGPTRPVFPTSQGATVRDGTVTWMESGQASAATSAWTPNTPYASGSTIASGGLIYVALPGMSGASPPMFPTASGATGTDNTVIWKESSGDQPASPTDGVITLLSLTLPQVHPLYYYNVATGVAVSSRRNPSFLRLQQPPPPNKPSAPAQYFTQKDQGSVYVAPILVFSAYIKPIDAERRWRPIDLFPAVSTGFSLSDPANSFYFGASSEIRRNVQVVYGVNLVKITALAPAGFVPSSSSTAPATKKDFATGVFIGMTVNIDFIKGLFGGGGGGGGSGKSQ